MVAGLKAQPARTHETEQLVYMMGELSNGSLLSNTYGSAFFSALSDGPDVPLAICMVDATKLRELVLC